MSEEGDLTGGGGGSPTPLVVDWLLATVESWAHSGRSKDEVVEKIMKSFDLKDLRNAARKLQEGKWAKIVVISESKPDYSRLLAGAVFDAIVSILNQEVASVRFCVNAADLHRVPGAAFVDMLDEPAVSARLGFVDARLEAILGKLEKTDLLEGKVEGLVRSVAALQDQLKEKEAAASSVQQQAALNGGSLPSYAVVAGNTGERSRLMHRLTGGNRGRSPSVKRRLEESRNNEQGNSKHARLTNSQREVQEALELRADFPQPAGSDLSQDLARHEQFQQVVRKKRGGSGVKKGSSTVEADGGEPAPLSVFVSRTSPLCTAESVKEKLKECAAAAKPENAESEGDELEILNVEEILLKIPPGEARRSRAWKVTVSPKSAGHMMSPMAYPAAWGWRKWQRGPKDFQSSQGRQAVRREDGGA